MAQTINKSACNAGYQGLENPLEEEMAAYSSIVAGKVTWTEEPGGLESMSLHRVGYD